MERIVVRGGVPLKGEVRVSGSKNSSLALIAATLLCEGESVIRGVPRVRDVFAMLELLRALGASADFDPADPSCVRICSDDLHTTRTPYELTQKLRGSIMVLGPLLARFGFACVSLPGGCAIGPRPIDLHLKGFEQLGAKVTILPDRIETMASPLIGRTIRFESKTVCGTQNVMMAATRAFGVTVIENAAREPEVKEVAAALTKMGADVRGAGSDKIVVRGVSALRPMNHDVEGDRIEAGTLLCAGLITGGDVVVTGIEPSLLDSMLPALRATGANIERGNGRIRATAIGRPEPVALTTGPYPGFPTDMQPQVMALASIGLGASRLTEAVFEDRLMHVPELVRMGADIRVNGRVARVLGVDELQGTDVVATDLRACAALILAGLAARGETSVSRTDHLDRGYEEIERKLEALGADVRREG
jgi:UDP-N-acetylglucosamine 1-carboxyvinyltransferase